MVYLTPVTKYGSVLAISASLWVLPVSLNAPRLITFLSLAGSLTGFFYCFKLADELAIQFRSVQKRQLMEDELFLHRLATKTSFLMDEISHQYEQKQQLLLSAAQPTQQNAAETKTVDPEVQVYINHLSELSQEIGWVSASVLKQRKRMFKDFSTEEIREFLIGLAEMGVGQLKGEGKGLEWSLTKS